MNSDMGEKPGIVSKSGNDRRRDWLITQLAKLSKVKISIAAFLSILFLSAMCSEHVAARPWRTGRLIAIETNGYGPSTDPKSKPAQKRTNIWWVYGICTSEITYYAATRVSPARIGLVENGSVKFSTDRTRLFIRDSRNKQHTLRMVRVEKGKGCGVGL